MDSLCSKCHYIFSTASEQPVASRFQRVKPEALDLHSDSIGALFASKSLPCHLCTLLWEANYDKFELLLKEGRKIGDPHCQGKAEVRWRWEKCFGQSDAGALSVARTQLVFYIRQRLLKDQAKRSGVGGWGVEVGGHPKDYGGIVFWMRRDVPIPKSLRTTTYNTDMISASTSSAETLELIKTWLSICRGTSSLAKHGPCNRWDRHRGNWNPTRVVEIKASGNGSSVRLFHPAPGCGPITYLTLSHRWAPGNPFGLTTMNIQNMADSISTDRLPKTFCDAIDITRRLGISYLWIDSLCIVQDCIDDWQIESSRMGDVYKFGLFNIAATRASNGDFEGLYVERSPLAIKPLLLGLPVKPSRFIEKPGKTQRYYIHRGFREWTEITHAMLNKRAWVFQERIMSPRTLHFCRSQVMYECCVAQCSAKWPRPSKFFLPLDESIHYPLKSSWGALKPDNALRFWYNVVRYYPTMKLTMESDRLVAISGIARSIQKALEGQEYIAGFWGKNLLPQLLWQVQTPATSRGEEREDEYVAPSWSWFTAQGQISDFYPPSYCRKQSTTALAELLDFTTTTIADPLGQVKDGFIKCRCQMAKGLIGITQDAKPRRISQHHKHINNEFAVLAAASFDKDTELQLDEIFLLPLFEFWTNYFEKGWSYAVKDRFCRRKYVTGLLLVSTGKNPGEFTRCGTFKTRWEKFQDFESCFEKG